MNRNMRKTAKVTKYDKYDGNRKSGHSPKRSKADLEIEEVFPPRFKRDVKARNQMLNRCCYIIPDQRSFAQDTAPFSQHFEKPLREQHGPVLPDLATIAQLQKLRSVLCGANFLKVENSCQYSANNDPLARYVDCVEPWPNAGTVVEVDHLKRDEGTLTQYHNLPKHCRISDVPKVKVIAEKFTKFKKNNIELRKLEEKVVCVEYDVFDDSRKEENLKPVQKMRAFFAVKMNNNEEKKVLAEMPPMIKNKFNISYEDLQKLNQKEIEIADGTIVENQSYLDDLRKILHRRKNCTRKTKNAINVQTLYEIAKRELLESRTEFDSTTLTKDEMLEVKNILENSKASIHGIRRRKVDTNSNILLGLNRECRSELTISGSLVTELLRVDSH